MGIPETGRLERDRFGALSRNPVFCPGPSARRIARWNILEKGAAGHPYFPTCPANERGGQRSLLAKRDSIHVIDNDVFDLQLSLLQFETELLLKRLG